MKAVDSILDTIGRTPLVRINKLVGKNSASVYAKLEYFNPAGSLKDRPALFMVRAAEREGKLKQGGAIVEPTSGNTGIALAMVGAVKGYKVICVMPDWMSSEKRKLMKALGAEVVITPTDVPREDQRSYYSVAKRIAKETGAFMPDQYKNPANIEAHYRTTGPEIWEQAGGKIDAVVIGIGTGGTWTGVVRYLKEKNPKMKAVLVDPEGSIIGGGEPHQFFIEGIGHFFVPENADLKLVDEVIKVRDEEALAMARRIAREEGIFAGVSSGAAMVGALKTAGKLGKGKNVVVLLPDSVERYLSYMHPDEKKGKRGFATKAIHGGKKRVEEYANSVAEPIFQSSTFKFRSAEDARRLFDEGTHFPWKKTVFAYSRGSNPTVRLLEARLAELEGAEDGIAFSSGMAAITALVLAVVKKGEHVVVTDMTYGRTHDLFADFLQQFGIEASFVDTAKIEEVKKAMRRNTRLIFIETPSNPLMKISDIGAISKVKGKALLAVDNTFMSPYFQSPLELGADVVVYSATKHISGHSNVLAGAVLGGAELIAKVRGVLYTTGAALDPFAAWLVMQGLKTLELRARRQEESAVKVADFLCKHPKVARVYYVGLSNHPQFELIGKQQKGYGNMISFELKGGIDAGKKLINNVKLCTLAVSLGAVETLIEHPASMTHASVSKEDREKAGLSDALVRISVGIEDAEDIIDDLKQALAKVN